MRLDRGYTCMECGQEWLEFPDGCMDAVCPDCGGIGTSRSVFGCDLQAGGIGGPGGTRKAA